MFLVNINRSSMDIAKLLQTQSQTEMKNAFFFFIVLIYTVQGRGVLLIDVERRIITISQTDMYVQTGLDRYRRNKQTKAKENIGRRIDK